MADHKEALPFLWAKSISGGLSGGWNSQLCPVIRSLAPFGIRRGLMGSLGLHTTWQKSGSALPSPCQSQVTQKVRISSKVS